MLSYLESLTSFLHWISVTQKIQWAQLIINYKIIEQIIIYIYSKNLKSKMS